MIQVLDAAIYHCQQSAEKSIKAYLTDKNIPFRKIHDISYLVSIAINIDPDFAELLDPAEKLSPYAVEYRYPDDELEPDIEKVKEALKLANTFFDFIMQKIQNEENLFGLETK